MKRNDIIKGIHAIEQAFNEGIQLQKIMVMKAFRNEKLGALLSLARHEGIAVQYVPKERLNRYGQNHQGIVAFSSPVVFQPLEEIITKTFEEGEIPFLIYLDGITDVRNMGAIARTAWYMGAHALIIPNRDSAALNDEAVKSSAGALLSIPVCRSQNAEQTLNYIKHSGIELVCATEKSDTLIYKVDMTGPICLIMGAEDKGIQPGILKMSSKLVKIPDQRAFNSLNVSVASGIACYEIVKQRNNFAD